MGVRSNSAMSGQGVRARIVRVAAAAIAVAALTLFLFWIFRKEESLEKAGTNGIEYLTTLNPDGLWNYMHEDEAEKLGLDPARFKLLVERFVKPRLADFSPEGEIRFDRFGDSGSNLMATKDFRNSKGKHLEMGFWVSYTGDGPKFVGVVASLVMSAFLANAKDEDEGHMISTLHRELRENRVQLESLGLKGLDLSTGYAPWTALEEKWSKSVEARKRAR